MSTAEMTIAGSILHPTDFSPASDRGAALFSETDSFWFIVILESATEVPILHVIGSRETPARLAAADRIKEVLPNIESVVVEGATHSGPTALFGTPEFVDAVRRFIAANRMSQ